MENINNPIIDQIIGTAFPQISELKYKFTEYALNTTYSFKFENLAHFTEFLQQHQVIGADQKLLLENTLINLNLKTDSFFFVNFFE